jgi:cyanophycinase
MNLPKATNRHKPILAALFLGLLAGPLCAVNRGALFIIGGALRADNALVYEEMIRLAGGREEAVIGIIAAASGTPAQTAQGIADDFTTHGVGLNQIRILPMAVVDDPSTADVDESAWVGNGFSLDLARTVSSCSLVFLSGGDQSRYRKTLLDEAGNPGPVLEALRALYQRGGVIAGTSAGAAVMSDPMLVSGTSLAALTKNGTDPLRLDRGLGFFPGFMVDQHFLKRGRLGRLLMTLLPGEHDSGHRLGIGVDEDTALVIQNGTGRVLGRSGCLLVDARRVRIENQETGLRLEDLRLHYLHSGDLLDLGSMGMVIDPQRRLIEPGQEYYDRFPASGDIFGRDTLTTLMTEGLGDCRQQEIFGLAFDPGGRGAVPGVRLRLARTPETRAYLGRIDGAYTYSVLQVRLDVEPVTVRIEAR